MRNWVDLDTATVVAIPLTDHVGGRRAVESALIEGPQGWGEFSPPPDCDDRRAARWLTAAVEAGTVGWPDPVRGRVPVAVVVPAVGPERAREIVAASGCRTAAVTVGEGALADDLARLAAVRDALGPGGRVRATAAGAWDPAGALEAVPQLDRAAGGLEFVEQPCASVADVASVRGGLGVPVAVDASSWNAGDSSPPDLSKVADIAVLTVGALGGVRRALRIAESCGVPCVVGAALHSSVGLAGGLALAGVLPESPWAAALGSAHLLAGDVVSDGRALVPVDGHLPVAPMPAAPDPVRTDRVAVTDPAVLMLWRNRIEAVSRFL